MTLKPDHAVKKPPRDIEILKNVHQSQTNATSCLKLPQVLKEEDKAQPFEVHGLLLI